MGLRSSQPLPEFEALRRRLGQQATTQQQSEEQQIKRQFARTGGTGSGAFLKQLQLAGQRGSQRKSAGEFQIGAAEAAESRRQQEIERGREFTAEQAQKQRGFVGAQGALQRAFQSGEGLKSRQFAGQQAQIGRQFSGGQAALQRQFAGQQGALQRGFGAEQGALQRGLVREQGAAQRGFTESQNLLQRAFQAGQAGDQRSFLQSLEDAKNLFQKEVFSFDKTSKLEQLDLARSQLEFEKDVAEFNKFIAEGELNKPTDLFSSLLGSPTGFGSGGLFDTAFGNFEEIL